MNPRSDHKPSSGGRSNSETHREELSRIYTKIKLYCIASGISDPIELHSKLDEFLNSVEREILPLTKKKGVDFETEAMKLFLNSGILRSDTNESSALPAIEPSSMVPNPVDFGPLGELAEPREKLEPVAVLLSILFWGSVYSFLLYGLLR